jgi:peptidoglycan hydrolase FlgJ
MADAISSNNTPTSSYLDFGGLGELRGRAQQNDPTALKQAAKHFEGAFIQMMLKSMRDANNVMKSDLIKSDAIDTFQDMFDKELSTQMANRNSLGVADMLVRQLTPQVPSSATLGAINPNGAMPLKKEAKPLNLHTDKKLEMPVTKPFLKPLPVRPLELSQDNQL